jgi:hypothetical protein
MSEFRLPDDMREQSRAEQRWLPFSAALTIALGLAVWGWRLDQVGNPFLMGVLVGALAAATLAQCMYVVYLGSTLRGAPRKSNLVSRLWWLARRS